MLDAQVRSAEELDDKTEQLLNLAVAALAGAITLGPFAAKQASSPFAPAGSVSLVVGGALNLAALRSLLGAYNVRYARQRPLFVGPDPASLERASRAARLSLAHHLGDVIASHASYHRTNNATMTRAARARAVGLHVLIASLVAYATTFVLIAGPRIWA